MEVPRRRGRENEHMNNLVCHKAEIIRLWKMSLTPCVFWYVSLKCGGSNFKLYRVWQLHCSVKLVTQLALGFECQYFGFTQSGLIDRDQSADAD